MKTKIKYAKVRKYDGGGNLNSSIGGVAGAVGTIGQQIGMNASTNADGSVNENGYALSDGLGRAGQGAALGTAIAPGIGTAIGAGVGLVGGLVEGYFGAKKKNKQVEEQKAQQEEYNKQLEIQKAKQKALEQDNYNKAYYTTNNINGNANASIYKFGGKFPGGGDITPEQYKQAQTDSMTLYKAGLSSNKYNGYYNYKGSKDALDNLEKLNGNNTIVAKKGWLYQNKPDINGKEYSNKDETMQFYKPTMIPYNPSATKNNNFEDQPFKTSPVNDRTYLKEENQYKTYRKNDGSIEHISNSGEVLYPDDKGLYVLNKEGKKVLAMGGTVKYAPGGVLQNLSNTTQKAIGDTHEEDSNNDGKTGIMLENKGKPYAEIENQEIIHNNKVYSNRLPYITGKSIANEAESISKKLGKYETNLETTNNRFEENSNKRMIDTGNKKLDNLFNYQQNLKQKLGIDNEMKPKLANGGRLDDGRADVDSNSNRFDNTDIYENTNSNNNSNNLKSTNNNSNSGVDKLGNLVPYIDNIYNSTQFDKTPKIPLPTIKEAYSQTAMPMKTSFNIDNQLSDANDASRQFNKNIDENTSSSNIGRANKLAGFSETLKNKNALYTNKENVETQLKNASAKNIQDVNNSNIKNAQDVYNSNLAQKDEYNWKNALRDSQIRSEKSANIQNFTNDAVKQVQDNRQNKLDQQRILTDSSQYQDGAGVANLLETDGFKEALKNNPSFYNEMESKLAKRPKDLEKFYKLYPKNK